MIFKALITLIVVYLAANALFDTLLRNEKVKNGEQSKFIENLIVFLAIARPISFYTSLIFALIYVWFVY